MESIINSTDQPAYYVGEAENYTSIYGYQKRIFRIHKLNPGQAYDPGMAAIGGIKEERIADENGNVVTTVFYTRSFERPRGLIRFFASPEALLIGFGLTPLYNRAEAPLVEARAKIVGLTHVKPQDTPPMLLLGNVELNQQFNPLGVDRAPLALAAPQSVSNDGSVSAMLTSMTNTMVEAIVGRLSGVSGVLATPKKKVKTTKRPAKKSAVKKAKKKAKRSY